MNRLYTSCDFAYAGTSVCHVSHYIDNHKRTDNWNLLVNSGRETLHSFLCKQRKCGKGCKFSTKLNAAVTIILSENVWKAITTNAERVEKNEQKNIILRVVSNTEENAVFYCHPLKRMWILGLWSSHHKQVIVMAPFHIRLWCEIFPLFDYFYRMNELQISAEVGRNPESRF